MIDLQDNRSKWSQIAEILAARIEDGTYPPGTKIPTIMEIMAEFAVTNRTAQKVVKALREQGLIRTESGMGSFVVEQRKAPGQE